MNYEQDDESGETVPLMLRPLAPDEWEANQALAAYLVIGAEDTPNSMSV